MKSITVDDLNELCRVYFEKRKHYEDEKAKLSKINEAYEAAEQDVVETLIALEMKKFDSKHGQISLITKEYYHVPKDPDSKEKIRKYLESKGTFENLWGINANTWNSWLKKEQEIAVEEGRFLDIPGVEVPTISYSLRKGK